MTDPDPCTVCSFETLQTCPDCSAAVCTRCQAEHYRDHKHTPPVPDRSEENRNEVPWWAHDARLAMGQWLGGEGARPRERLWAIHDSITAPAEARARQAEQERDAARVEAERLREHAAGTLDAWERDVAERAALAAGHGDKVRAAQAEVIEAQKEQIERLRSAAEAARQAGYEEGRASIQREIQACARETREALRVPERHPRAAAPTPKGPEPQAITTNGDDDAAGSNVGARPGQDAPSRDDRRRKAVLRGEVERCRPPRVSEPRGVVVEGAVLQEVQAEGAGAHEVEAAPKGGTPEPPPHRASDPCYWCSKPLGVGGVWWASKRGHVHAACEEQAVRDGRLVPPAAPEPPAAPLEPALADNALGQTWGERRAFELGLAEGLRRHAEFPAAAAPQGAGLDASAFVAAVAGVLARAVPDGDKAVMLRWLIEDAAPSAPQVDNAPSYEDGRRDGYAAAERDYQRGRADERRASAPQGGPADAPVDVATLVDSMLDDATPQDIEAVERAHLITREQRITPTRDTVFVAAMALCMGRKLGSASPPQGEPPRGYQVGDTVEYTRRGTITALWVAGHGGDPVAKATVKADPEGWGDIVPLDMLHVLAPKEAT